MHIKIFFSYVSGMLCVSDQLTLHFQNNNVCMDVKGEVWNFFLIQNLRKHFPNTILYCKNLRQFTLLLKPTKIPKVLPFFRHSNWCHTLRPYIPFLVFSFQAFILDFLLKVGTTVRNVGLTDESHQRLHVSLVINLSLLY